MKGWIHHMETQVLNGFTELPPLKWEDQYVLLKKLNYTRERVKRGESVEEVPPSASFGGGRGRLATDLSCWALDSTEKVKRLFVCTIPSSIGESTGWVSMKLEVTLRKPSER